MAKWSREGEGGQNERERQTMLGFSVTLDHKFTSTKSFPLPLFSFIYNLSQPYLVISYRTVTLPFPPRALIFIVHMITPAPCKRVTVLHKISLLSSPPLLTKE